MIVRYFQKSLKPFVLTKLQNKDLELKSFLEIVKKRIVAKAKSY